ncbi:hypothetical protein Rcae01_01173 [Novipirellula caenicola]|uniref:Uncharacterized protein n=1 Tax=Novipirellula caenicola TaxID=1536901 RepID=A0ABP9VKL1_9BACT
MFPVAKLVKSFGTIVGQLSKLEPRPMSPARRSGEGRKTSHSEFSGEGTVAAKSNLLPRTHRSPTQSSLRSL